jgi:2-keto-4-pentenoate hydratase
VEAETAVRLGLDGEIAEILVVIELHHYVFRGTPATLAELVANNAVHAGAVVGSESLAPGALSQSAQLTLSIDGRAVDLGPPFPMRGGAPASVAWLRDNLDRTGRTLRAGDLVLTGTSLGIHEVGAGHTIEARLDGLPPTVARLVSRPGRSLPHLYDNLP